MCKVQIINSGYFDSLQDIGRFGYSSLGIPVSGVMDTISAKMANTLVDNNLNCTVLEMTLIGPKLLFQKDAIIAISGANMNPTLNGKPLQMLKRIKVNKRDVLSFSHAKFGCRSYLAVNGGFKTESVLKSFSFTNGITKKNKLINNDILLLDEGTTIHNTNNSHIKFNKHFFESPILDAFKGPEYDLLSEKQKKFLKSNIFQIALNSRMGYQFKASSSLSHSHEILTSSVMPGTVQLTQSGKIIVLMKDCQTTGGFPRILQLSEKSQSILAQKNTSQKVSFKLNKIFL